MPPMRAATTGSRTISSIVSSVTPSRFIATAVASSSMWPSSSVPVWTSISRYVLRPARTPRLEQVLQRDAHLTLWSTDRLLQYAGEHPIRLVHRNRVGQILLVEEHVAPSRSVDGLRGLPTAPSRTPLSARWRFGPLSGPVDE